MTWLLSVKPSERKDKRYTATFCKCKEKNACRGENHKNVSFGDPTATTYVDGASEQKKAAYIARHSKVKGEDFNKPQTPGSLAFHLLWGSYRSLRENIKSFKKKFNL
jgi:hypothetical protein